MKADGAVEAARISVVAVGNLLKLYIRGAVEAVRGVDESIKEVVEAAYKVMMQRSQHLLLQWMPWWCLTPVQAT